MLGSIFCNSFKDNFCKSTSLNLLGSPPAALIKSSVDILSTSNPFKSFDKSTFLPAFIGKALYIAVAIHFMKSMFNKLVVISFNNQTNEKKLNPPINCMNDVIALISKSTWFLGTPNKLAAFPE